MPEKIKQWLYVGIIGLCMAITVRLIAEAASSDAKKINFIEGKINILNNRVIQLESKTHPATNKRFTSDDAVLLETRIAECIDSGYPMQQCLHKKKQYQVSK